MPLLSAEVSPLAAHPLHHPVAAPPLRRLFAGSFLVFSLLLLGCSIFSRGSVFSGFVLLRVDEIRADLNNDFPVAVEAIVVYEQSAERLLSTLTAATWFDQRSRLLGELPAEAVSATRWEWVPGQAVDSPLEIRYRTGARQLFLFASFFAAGQHRTTLELGTTSVLRLEANGFVVDSKNSKGSSPPRRKRSSVARQQASSNLPELRVLAPYRAYPKALGNSPWNPGQSNLFPNSLLQNSQAPNSQLPLLAATQLEPSQRPISTQGWIEDRPGANSFTSRKGDDLAQDHLECDRQSWRRGDSPYPRSRSRWL